MDLLNRAKQLQDRTKKFAVRIIKAFAKLPKDEATRVLGDNSSDRELRWLRIMCRLSSEIERRLYFEDYCCERGSRRNPLLAGAAYRFGTNHQQESRIAND